MTLVRHVAAALVAAVIIGVLSVTIGAYRDYQMSEVAAYIPAVAGLTVLSGLSGQITVGNGAFMAIGAYAAALLLAHLGWSLGLLLVASIVAAALAGVIVGVIGARLRGPYLAGLTLMLAVAVPTVAEQYGGVFGGDQGLSLTANTPAFLGPTFPSSRWLAWVTCGAALIVLVLLANLGRSRIGRSWRAIRDDEVAAALSGLNVARLQVLAFVVSAGCAGLGGALLAITTTIVAPGAYTLTLSVALLTAAVIGGLGRRSVGQPAAGRGAHVPHERGRQSRPVKWGGLEHTDRGLRRDLDRHHAHLPRRHPGRPAPHLPARPAHRGRAAAGVAPPQADQ
jgi:branched-chain amino acid transport system permease protein